MATLRAHFDGKAFTPLDPAPFAAGRVYEIDVREPAALPEDERGNPAAVLRALQALPPVSREDTDALLRAIEEGRLPVRESGAFDEAE